MGPMPDAGYLPKSDMMEKNEKELLEALVIQGRDRYALRNMRENVFRSYVP